MKISRSLRVSAQNAESNWVTEEVSIELDAADVTAIIPPPGSHRLLAKILDYEAQVFLCKSVKDPVFEAYIKQRLEGLKVVKVEVDDAKKQLGIS